MSHIAGDIDALLPQTQCTRCGYPSCRDYARAIAAGEADINQCPPGGEETIRALARLLARPAKPLDPAFGTHKPLETARIDESLCIGCMLCIRACPVDAIVGTAKRMHTVLTAHCTGCELCLPPCPVDCIQMIPVESLAGEGNAAARAMLAQSPPERAEAARKRFEFRRERLHRDRIEREQRLARKAGAKQVALEGEPAGAERDRKKAVVKAALERARERRRREAASRGERS
jgi:Na+-translocating ferredoxin:NAD+ oxidoreductase subunit B